MQFLNSLSAAAVVAIERIIAKSSSSPFSGGREQGVDGCGQILAEWLELLKFSVDGVPSLQRSSGVSQRQSCVDVVEDLSRAPAASTKLQSAVDDTDLHGASYFRTPERIGAPRDRPAQAA
ncbi:MAG: hypothetical protein DMF84_24445 [Acidobacteria bacterium]|nr:MAG: hypothetical protein DMF84_24445 [Acidobacteriota bacterium]